MKARKKPVVIEFYPCEEKYLDEIMKWSTDDRPIIRLSVPTYPDLFKLRITTLEGIHEAYKGNDMIIKGINGEVYPCKKEIFEKTYDVLT